MRIKDKFVTTFGKGGQSAANPITRLLGGGTGAGHAVGGQNRTLTGCIEDGGGWKCALLGLNGGEPGVECARFCLEGSDGRPQCGLFRQCGLEFVRTRIRSGALTDVLRGRFRPGTSGCADAIVTSDADPHVG